MNLSKLVFWISLDKEMELLGHMIVLLLIFWGIFVLFPGSIVNNIVMTLYGVRWVLELLAPSPHEVYDCLSTVCVHLKLIEYWM